MVATARAHLLGRVQGRHLLVIQDTTSLRDDGNKRGLYLHPAIVVDAADGALLGLLSADLLVHDDTPKVHCNKRALEDKESRRWVDVNERAEDLLRAGAASVTMIADREADLYEAFACRPDDVEVLVRANHDRSLAGGGRLYTGCTAQPELGRQTVNVLPAPGRPARKAVVALRARRISIKRPKRNRAQWAAALPAHVELTLVEAREVDPPAGQTPLHWRLLTTRAAETLAEAQRIVELYRQRWMIDIDQTWRLSRIKGWVGSICKEAF